MNKNTQSNHIVITILGFFFALHFGFAQVQTAFTPRFNETVNGDVTTIANNMLSRHATADYNGVDGNHDFNDNVYVDIDSDPTTFNSSNATFNNPEPSLACVSIVKAYLYWAAADKETNGNDNQPDWNFNDVKLMLPGETTYTTITADDVIYRGRDTHFSNDPYVCFKDITESVIALDNPYGTYQVANVECKTGGLYPHPSGNTGTSGGWQIVYVYHSPELTTKNIGLFDGYAHVTDNLNNFDIDFSGFQTVPVGTVNANVVLGSLEGDRDLLGDRLQIRDVSNNFIDLSAPLRDTDNFFNSRITIGNTDFVDRVPASTNTLGFDAAVFALDNTGNSIIGNDQTSATIRLTSNQETYGLYLIGLSVDVWAPNLYPIKVKSDAVDNITASGDNVLIDFNFSNTGNDDAINVVLSTELPTNVEFVDVHNLPTGVTHSYDIDTRILQFFVEDGLVDVGDPELAMQIEIQVREECYFLEESCDLTFDLQLVATYNGVENPTLQTTYSSHDLDECQLGTVLPMTIIQPDAAVWANPPGDLDRTVTCDNPDDLPIAQSLFPDTDKCTFTLSKTSGPFVPSGCGSSGTYTNTWTFTDACGRTIADYVQTITLVDNSAPIFEALPNDTTLGCSDTPNFQQPVITDACSSNIDLTFEDVTTNGSCDGDYTITRTWTAIDDCGNTATASQTINFEDTTPPTLVSPLDSEISIICQLPPEIPNLEFTDNCSANVEVVFSEEIVEIDFTNFDIIRTWDIFDDCANENTYTQVIHMETTKSNETIELNLCANDNTIDLNNYVENDGSGYWESTNLNLSNNTILDPSQLDEGSYSFNYIANVNDCIEVTEIVVNIQGDCEETPNCIRSAHDVDISKLVTPNGDLKNQTFDVAYILNPNIDKDESCNIIVKVKIFNRWGNKVFESTDYKNSWEGTAGAGIGAAEALPSGTYYYVVTLENSGLKPIQGYILLGTEQ